MSNKRNSKRLSTTKKLQRQANKYSVAFQKGKRCFLCKREFNVLKNPQRHCRFCGQCVCSSCSRHRMKTPHSKNLKRACDNCWKANEQDLPLSPAGSWTTNSIMPLDQLPPDTAFGSGNYSSNSDHSDEEVAPRTRSATLHRTSPARSPARKMPFEKQRFSMDEMTLRSSISETPGGAFERSAPVIKRNSSTELDSHCPQCNHAYEMGREKVTCKMCSSAVCIECCLQTTISPLSGKRMRACNQCVNKYSKKSKPTAFKPQIKCSRAECNNFEKEAGDFRACERCQRRYCSSLCEMKAHRDCPADVDDKDLIFHSKFATIMSVNLLKGSGKCNICGQTLSPRKSKRGQCNQCSRVTCLQCSEITKTTLKGQRVSGSNGPATMMTWACELCAFPRWSLFSFCSLVPFKTLHSTAKPRVALTKAQPTPPEHWREQVHAFFSRYQPARLQTDAHFVNNILAHWAGREAELMETLNRRSQPEPADTSDSRPYTDPSDATSDADVRSSETSGESDVEAPPEHDGDSVSRAHTVDHAEIRSGDNHNSCTHPHRSTGINLHTDTQSNPHTHPPSSDSGHHVTTETSTADVADRYEDVGDVRRAEDAVSMPHRTQVQSKPDTKDMELRRAEAVVLAREAQRKTQLETKREPLVAWLNDCCGLGARVEEFIALGVDEVSDFNLIEISDLEDMGLTTPLINMFMSNVDVEDWDKDFMNSSYV